MVIVKEKAPLLGKSFHTGLHYFPIVGQSVFYSEHEAGLNYAVFCDRAWWMGPSTDIRFEYVKTNAFQIFELTFFGLFI